MCIWCECEHYCHEPGLVPLIILSHIFIPHSHLMLCCLWLQSVRCVLVYTCFPLLWFLCYLGHRGFQFFTRSLLVVTCQCLSLSLVKGSPCLVLSCPVRLACSLSSYPALSLTPIRCFWVCWLVTAFSFPCCLLLVGPAPVDCTPAWLLTLSPECFLISSASAKTVSHQQTVEVNLLSLSVKCSNQPSFLGPLFNVMTTVSSQQSMSVIINESMWLEDHTISCGSVRNKLKVAHPISWSCL